MRPTLRLILAAIVGALLLTGIGAAISPADQSSLHATMDKFVTVANWYDQCVASNVVKANCLPATTVPPTTTTTVPPTTTTTRPPVTTTTVPPVPAMPTKANTGPTNITGTMTAAAFLSSGVCDHKRIVEQVNDQAGTMAGRTFTIDNCALDGGLFYASDSPNMPTITVRSSSIVSWILAGQVRATIDHSFLTQAFWTACVNCAAEDHQANQTQRAMPITVTNSYFWAPQPPPPPYPYHSEALHVVGAGIGYSFNNVRFTQEGPVNDNITAALKFTGRDSTFTSVFLDWGGTAPAAWYGGYWEGVNVTVNGCRIEQGNARPGYEFPDVWSAGNGYVVPPLQNCKDWTTGALIP